MGKLILDGVREHLEKEVSGSETNTYISMPKKYKGKKVLVVILDKVK